MDRFKGEELVAQLKSLREQRNWACAVVVSELVILGLLVYGLLTAY